MSSVGCGINAIPLGIDVDRRDPVGVSEAFTAVKQTAAGIAGRQTTVMLLGETGTGKEVLARYIHDHSNRSAKPFIPVDCSALTDTLFESELFGHLRGAFTGATRDSLGFFRAADGGTLFLDEIGELSLPLQAKLLRVIQDRAVVPVGDTRARPVDVRIVTATNRDLSDMVRRGTFRADLFYRLNVVALNLPPLRERPQDVIPLAEHFLRRQSELYDEPEKHLDAAAATALRRHPWPGNVRELANVVEHAYVLSPGVTIQLEHLPPRLHAGDSAACARIHADGNGELLLIDVERRTIAEALRRSKGIKAAACRLLGINAHRLNRRMRHLGIQIP